MSLRLRLNLLLGLLDLGFLVALCVVFVGNFRTSIGEEIEAAHRVAVQLLATAAQSSPLMGPAPAVMYEYVRRLGRVRANEIRLYAGGAEPSYVSPPSPYKAGREAPHWFVRLMRPPVDATVIELPGARLEVVPDASRAILDAWDSLAAIALVALAFLAVLHGASLWFFGRLLEPAERILGGLGRLAEGRFDTRLATSEAIEWRRVTEGFNRVAAALQQREAEQRELAATAQALAENRETTRLIQQGVEAERKRLARELHDELGQSVTAIRAIAASIARGGASSGAQKIEEIAGGLYDGVHRIVRELRPAVLDASDLRAALEDLAHEWRQRHPQLRVELACEGDCGDLAEDTVLTVFRTVQEALTNVLKHAGASGVRIGVRRESEGLRVSVRDDGAGAGEPWIQGSGQGLAGMRERALALGGSLEARPCAGGGFEVRLWLPGAGGGQ